jgi:hypothetical protein
MWSVPRPALPLPSTHDRAHRPPPRLEPPYGDNPPTHWAPVHRPPLRVRVRIEWDTGEEWHEAIASAYDPRDGAVYIYLEDARTRVKGLWMHTSDVVPLGLVE